MRGRERRLAAALGALIVSAIAAAGCVALSAAQRAQSAPARRLRRSAVGLRGTQVLDDGLEIPLPATGRPAALDRALMALSAGIVRRAVGRAAARWWRDDGRRGRLDGTGCVAAQTPGDVGYSARENDPFENCKSGSRGLDRHLAVLDNPGVRSTRPSVLDGWGAFGFVVNWGVPGACDWRASRRRPPRQSAGHPPAHLPLGEVDE